MLKHFILDTNVLIHNPGALYSFTDNEVIIPITVIEELDRLKTSSDKVGMHARQALREIDSLVRKGAVKQGAKMKDGGHVRVFMGSRNIELPDMDLSLNDNKILMAAYELHSQGEEVFFVSKDVNARIKAEALGIRSVDYEKQKVAYNVLYRGWRELTLPPDQINELFKEGKLNSKGFTLNENEFAHIKSDDGSNASALCKYDSSMQELILLPNQYDAMGVHPINMEQRFAFDLLLNDKIQLVTLVGQAGTGKTLIALACGLAKTIGMHNTFKKILVARPIIPMGKDIGYLPGTKDQKLNYWMQPIFDNLEYILHDKDHRGRKHKEKENEKHSKNEDDLVYEAQKNQMRSGHDRIDELMQNGILEIEALTYIRGRSIPQQYLIVDEAQNLTPHEVKTIISRAGHGTKVILTGDAEQIDNPYLDANSNGLSYIVERMKNQKIVGHVFLSKSERSELASLAVETL